MFLGLDPICGAGDNSLLSTNLIHELHSHNLFVLKDIFAEDDLSKWDDAGSLGLIGRNATDWDMFISTLKQVNIFIFDSPDELVW